MKSIYTTKLIATIGDVEYEWFGGVGSVMLSRERGVRRGQCRVIGDVLFHAYMIDEGWLWSKIHWSPAASVDVAWVNEFRRAVFMA